MLQGKEENEKKKRLHMVANVIKAVVICVGDVENIDEWRFRVRAANTKYLREKEDTLCLNLI
jgi:hypothetical protein